MRSHSAEDKWKEAKLPGSSWIRLCLQQNAPGSSQEWVMTKCKDMMVPPQMPVQHCVIPQHELQSSGVTKACRELFI